MGEEAKQEEFKTEEKQEEKPEEKKEDEKKEEKVEEEKKPEEPPKPPSPLVLSVDLHCVGCAKRIERSLMRVRGVEGVVIDMAQDQITVKGIVDPQALCMRIQKKTKRRASILSPLPPAEGEPTPQFVTSQARSVVYLWAYFPISGYWVDNCGVDVNMHCEACAQQLKRKILKMRGVQTAENDWITGKVTVIGTMDAQHLVDYVYRRTKKQARIVPQPEPEPVPDPEPQKAEAQPAEPEKPEEKKEEGEKEAPKSEEKKEENAEKKEEEKPAEPEPEKNYENGGKEEKGDENKEEGNKMQTEENNINEERMNKMMHYYPPYYAPVPYYQPRYVIERIPAPQIFSEENPNACCIS